MRTLTQKFMGMINASIFKMNRERAVEELSELIRTLRDVRDRMNY